VGALVTIAGDRRPAPFVERVAGQLRVPHVDVIVGTSEAAVLWDKLVRLAAMAAVTSAAGCSIGDARSSAAWRPRLLAALEEAASVAATEGVEVDLAATVAFVDGLPGASWTSTSLDVEAGRPSELDAIAGSALRAAARHGLECPVLAELVIEAEGRAACLAR
jgi:2-dehydropantoate 2-reductase